MDDAVFVLQIGQCIDRLQWEGGGQRYLHYNITRDMTEPNVLSGQSAELTVFIYNCLANGELWLSTLTFGI